MAEYEPIPFNAGAEAPPLAPPPPPPARPPSHGPPKGADGNQWPAKSSFLPTTDLNTQINFLQSAATQYPTNASAITDDGIERKIKVRQTTAIGQFCKILLIAVLIGSVVGAMILGGILLNR